MALVLFAEIKTDNWEGQLGFPKFNSTASVVAAMEAITEGVNNVSITDSYKKNRIQVSNTKKPLFFYVNLAKVS